MHFVEKEPLQKRKDFDTKLKSNKILRRNPIGERGINQRTSLSRSKRTNQRTNQPTNQRTNQ